MPGVFMSISRNPQYALVLVRLRVGAHETEDPVSAVCLRGPDLLAVHDVLIAAQHPRIVRRFARSEPASGSE